MEPSQQAHTSDGKSSPVRQDPATEPASDESLLRAHVEGDEAAFRKLFERHAPRMYGVMLRSGFGDADAQDMVQQTFIRAHQARRDFTQGSRVRPWLWTIAYNLMRDAGRRSGARGRALGALGRAREAAAEQRGTSNEVGLSVAHSLEQLPPSLRDVIVLHYYEGLSFPEVAGVLGITQSAARVRAHRAYARLRELLADDASPTHQTEGEDALR